MQNYEQNNFDLKLDNESMKKYISLIHERAHGIDGKLVIAAYGENPIYERPMTPRVKHFKPGQVKETIAYIQEIAREEHRNVYISLAVMRSDLPEGKKGSEADAVAVLGVVADFDAKDDKEAWRYKERLPVVPTLVIETSSLPEPSYQAVILFDKPMSPAEAKKFAIFLTRYSKCDHGTQDISHVWRVIGGLNWPNKKKLDSGRPKAPQPVKLLEYNEGLLLTYERMLELMAQRGKNTSDTFTDAIVQDIGIEQTTNLPVITVDNLNITQRIKTIIKTGSDPENPERYKSRSEAMMAVMTAMAKAGYDNASILSICLNPENRISEKALEQRDPAKWVLNQLPKAIEFAEQADPLTMLNKKHAIVREIGKVVILNEEWDFVRERHYLSRSSIPDFKNFYANQTVLVGKNEQGETISMKMGQWWLDHLKRRQYEGVTFAPLMKTPGQYNLWRGYPLEAKAGNWSLMRQHILEVLCDGNITTFEYLIKWMARAVQEPGKQGEVAIVLRGKRGVGKSIYVKYFGKIFGQHYLQIANQKHLTGNFNAHIQDCILLFADEAFWAGDKQGESVLKMLVTEDYIAIERKGRDVVTSKNCTHLILASNNCWVVPAGQEERRFLVLDVSDKYMQDTEHFGCLAKQMEEGGTEAMFYDLLHMDISGFNVRKAPNTKALLEQKLHSLDPHEKWWLDMLADGKVRENDEDWPVSVEKDALYSRYIEAVGKIGAKNRSGETQLGIHLRRLLPKGFPEKHVAYVEKKVYRQAQEGEERTEETTTARVTMYTLPSLQMCREHFEGLIGEKIDWPMNEAEKKDAEATTKYNLTHV